LSSILTEPCPPQALHCGDALFDRQASQILPVELFDLAVTVRLAQDAFDHAFSLASAAKRGKRYADAGDVEDLSMDFSIPLVSNMGNFTTADAYTFICPGGKDARD
jgi:hypothetical protein